MFRIDSLLSQFGQILALKWPRNDWKWWFPTIIWKSIHTIQIKLGMDTYWLSVQNWFTFGPHWWFLTIICKSIHTIQFKFGVYTYWVNVQNWLAFGPRWPNFGPLVATKWLEMVVSNHYLRKFHYICGIMITQSISNMMFTLVRGIFTNDSIFCHIGLI